MRERSRSRRSSAGKHKAQDADAPLVDGAPVADATIGVASASRTSFTVTPGSAYLSVC